MTKYTCTVRLSYFWAMGVRICFISSMMLFSLSGFSSTTFSMVLHTDDWTEKSRVSSTYIKVMSYHERVSMCMHLADGEGVPVQLLCEHESLSEHSFVVVGVLDDGRGGGMTKHRAHVTFQ